MSSGFWYATLGGGSVLRIANRGGATERFAAGKGWVAMKRQSQEDLESLTEKEAAEFIAELAMSGPMDEEAAA